MPVLYIIMPAVAAMLLAAALTPLTRTLASRLGAVDVPSARKVHTTPIPRLGGLAVILAIVIVETVWTVVAPAHTHIIQRDLLVATAIGALPIALVSLIDDIRSLRALPKLIVHLAGAGATVALGVRLGDSVHLFGAQVHIGWLSIPISILWLAGMANAFNFIDGLDGLSAGLALISSISLAGVAIVTAKYEVAATALVLAGAVAGFLPFNIHPASVYLGDTGATAIGFFLGALTLRGGSTATAGLAVALPLVVVGVPLADAVVSIIRRAVHKFTGGGGIMDADRDHIHHRLLALGYTHGRAVRLLYGIGIAVAVLGFASVFINQEKAALLLAAMVVAAIVGIVKLDYDEFALIRRGAVLRFYESAVLRKGFFAVFIDLSIVIAAIYATIVLKYDDWGLQAHRGLALDLLVIAPAATVAAFGALGIYRRSWSKADLEDILRLGTAVFVSCALTTIVLELFRQSTAPLTFFALYSMVGFGFMSSSRVSYRVLLHWNRRSNRSGQPVLIYGAGKGGVLALREISTNSDVDMQLIGFIDDDPSMHGRVINGYPVLGDLEELEQIVTDCGAKGVIVASQKIPVQNVRVARRICGRNGAWLSTFEVNFRRATPTPTPVPPAPRHEMSRMSQ